jgi:hypothetical protein
MLQDYKVVTVRFLLGWRIEFSLGCTRTNQLFFVGSPLVMRICVLFPKKRSQHQFLRNIGPKSNSHSKDVVCLNYSIY